MENPVIVYGVGLIDVNTLKKATHNVTSIHADSFSDMVKIVVEKGKKVEVINITIEESQRIGFINLNALKDYCRKIK